MPKERSSEKKAARALAAELGVPYTVALRKLREQREHQDDMPVGPAEDLSASED
jgi:hypothetical protein